MASPAMLLFPPPLKQAHPVSVAVPVQGKSQRRWLPIGPGKQEITAPYGSCILAVYFSLFITFGAALCTVLFQDLSIFIALPKLLHKGFCPVSVFVSVAKLKQIIDVLSPTSVKT